MISVQNHLLPLSGNKFIFWLALALIISACSPKVQPVSNPKTTSEPVPATKKEPVKQPPAKSVPKVSTAKFLNIALLLPFDLDKLSSATGYSKAGLTKANVAVDFYQGFKLALDSLTADGYNYRLQVYDTKDEMAQARSLAMNPQIRTSDLIVGPVFPEGIKTFVTAFKGVNKPVLSPLAPTPPTDFNNPNIITAMPPLEYHARRTAKYVSDNYKPKRVFILKSGYSEDNKYSLPFKLAIDSLGRKRVKIVEVVISRGNLAALIPQLSPTEENVFVVPSVKQAFLMVTLRAIDNLAKKYPITVIGHPNWEKFSYLKPDMLQRLKTHITTADRVNYRSANTIAFIKSFRRAYRREPTEYAIKGFDEGLYFGELLANGKDGLKKLNDNEAEAIHNSFEFIKKPRLGWINTHVNVLKYVNFELKQVE